MGVTDLHLPKPAKSHLAFDDSASIHTDITSLPLRTPGGLFRQAEGLAAPGVNRGDLWPHLIKMAADTINTKADDVGNSLSSLMAITARAHES